MTEIPGWINAAEIPDNIQAALKTLGVEPTDLGYQRSLLAALTPSMSTGQKCVASTTRIRKKLGS